MRLVLALELGPVSEARGGGERAELGSGGALGGFIELFHGVSEIFVFRENIIN